MNQSPGPARSRVSSDEASERLIETTIEMLREMPFRDLSVRTIAARADLNKSTIERCFGSIEGLFMTVCNRLTEQVVEGFENPDDPFPFLQPDVILGVRFRGWLITSGADPAGLRFTRGNSVEKVLSARQQQLRGVSPLTAQTFAQILAFLVEGYTVFNESRAIDDEVRGNILVLIDQLAAQLPEAEVALGWDGRAEVEAPRTP